MIELDKEALQGLLRFNQKRVALYFYTPFCGTCKVAIKMLEIAVELLPQVCVYTCNLNAFPNLALEWQITSVPALVIIEKNIPVRKVYAMQSVPHLYSILETIAEDKEVK